MTSQYTEDGKIIRSYEFGVSAQTKKKPQSLKPASSDTSKGKPRTNTAAPAVKPKSKTAAGPAVNKKVKAAVKPIAKKSVPIVRTVDDVRVIPFPTTAIFLAVVCTLLFMVMLISFVNINEITIKIDELETKVSELSEQEKELVLQLEKKNDLRVIEDYAKNVLGMVKIDQLAKKYIKVEVYDKIERIEKESSSGGAVSDFWTGFIKSFSVFWEYFK